jgi:uncharacterized protein (TIGR03083 family)
MNPLDVLKYGHATVLRAVADLPEADWHTAGVCGYWSVREIIAHLASFERALAEAIDVAGGAASGPQLTALLRNGQAFNDAQVAARAGLSVAETLAEYESAHQAAAHRAAGLPTEQFRQVGFLPRYGSAYDLEDFIAYSFYGHKREHSAQIAVFRDHIQR